MRVIEDMLLVMGAMYVIVHILAYALVGKEDPFVSTVVAMSNEPAILESMRDVPHPVECEC